jgi:hypothetical protein
MLCLHRVPIVDGAGRGSRTRRDERGPAPLAATAQREVASVGTGILRGPAGLFVDQDRRSVTVTVNKLMFRAESSICSLCCLSRSGV